MVCGRKSGKVSSYLRASSNGDDTSQEISNHRFQGNRQAINMDGVDQTQTVLFRANVGSQNKRVPSHAARILYILIR